MTKKTGFQLYKHIKAGHIFLGTQASDKVGYLSQMISSRPSKKLNSKTPISKKASWYSLFAKNC